MLLKKSKLFSIIMCIITALSVFSLVFPHNVRAEENKSITLVCVSGNTILPGMKWKLYKVGERTNNNMNFVQTGDFAGIQVNLRKLTSERVNEVAMTFQTFAVANGLTPLREGQTDENGEVQFTGLDAGLYLIAGKLLKIDTHYYVPTTSLIEVKEDDSDLRYNAYPKFEYQVANAQPRRYTAHKRWNNDEEHLNERPKQVIFDIYKDEEYYDSVVLSDENKWEVSWVDNEGVSSWLVMEKNVPPKYEMKITYDNSRYWIDNSYTEEVIDNTSSTSNSGQTASSTTTTSSGEWGNDTATRTRPSDVSNITVSRTSTTTASGNWGNDTATRTRPSDVSNATVTRTGTDVSDSSNSGSTTTSKKNGDNGGGSGNGNGGNSSGGKGNGSSSGGKSNSGGGSSSGRKLPQTGQLWWPVVPLSIGGVLLVGAGLVIRARRKED